MATKIQIRRGTANQWGNSNPLLAAGEISVETDTGKMKIGDGATRYGKLRYLDDKDEIIIGSWYPRLNSMEDYSDNKDLAIKEFDRMCDIYCSSIKSIDCENLYVKLIGIDGGILGAFGPDASKDEMYNYIQQINTESALTAIFYVKLHGEKIHSVLFNEVYGSVCGNIKSSKKNLNLDESETLYDFVVALYRDRWGKTIDNNNIESAIRTIRKTSKKRGGRFYRPGSIAFDYIDEDTGNKIVLYDSKRNIFIPLTPSISPEPIYDIIFSKTETLFYKRGKYLDAENEEWVDVDYLDDVPGLKPSYMEDEVEYEPHGMMCVYEYTVEDIGDETYKYYRIGGCGNDSIALILPSQPTAIGLNNEKYTCNPYIYYKLPNQSPKLKILDDIEIDCSSVYGIDVGHKPFAKVIKLSDIEEYIKSNKKGDRGPMKFRLGIYNPNNHNFSQLTPWLKYKREWGIADHAVEFLFR